MLKFIRFLTAGSLIASVALVEGFAPSSQHLHAATTSSQLDMTSRREVLQTTSAALGAASLLVLNPTRAQAGGMGRKMTETSAANKANESYQGVYYDPNHPNGYRVIMATKDANKATMTLSDGVSKEAAKAGETAKTYDGISVAVQGNDLVFDFGFKGGPKGIKGTLSEDKQSITFEDGNTWTKNYYKYDGIYKVTTGGDSLSPDAYRVIRKNGADITVEINDTGNPKDSKFIDASCETLFSIPTSAITFYYGGKGAPSREVSFLDQLEDWQRGGSGNPTKNTPTVIGQLSLQDFNTVFPYGTITFPDKSVWTRQ